MRTEKDVLKAENAQLTQDIRDMRALRTKQVALEAEMARIVGGIHERHARIEKSHRFAVKRARVLRKMAAQIEEDRLAELKVAEGIVEPYIEVDEDDNVFLMQKYGDDAETEGLFDAYVEAKSSVESLAAAVARLRQSRAELLDLGDLVSKVEMIAIGDLEVPCGR